MKGPRRVLAGLAVGLVTIVGRLSAQDVAEIQVLPAQVNIGVGQEETLFATLFDARGNPVPDANIVWTSNDLSVVTVSWDQAASTLATVQAVGAGTAQIEARVGNVRSSVVIVFVTQELEQAEPAPEEPTVPDSVLPPETSTASLGLIARVEAHNFGFAQDCRVGGFVANNLLMTSYLSIRGADSVVVVLPSGTRVTSGVRVAAYDADLGLAVLHVPSTRTGEFAVGGNPSANDFVWVVGQPNCQASRADRNVVNTIQPGTGGRINLRQASGLGQLGAPIINRDGDIVGIALDGADAVRAADVASLANQARRNLGAGGLLALSEVAAAQSHRYGSISLSSELLDAVARITGLENWHWPELNQQSRLPINFAGPQGRYRVDLISSGAVQSTTEVTIQPGIASQQVLSPVQVAPTPVPEQAQPPGAEVEPQGGGGGGGAIIAVLLLAAGGGAAALLLAGGGDGNGTNGNGIEPPPTGGVTITVIIP